MLLPVSAFAIIGWILCTVILAWMIRDAFVKKNYNRAWLLMTGYMLLNGIIYWMISSLISSM